CQHGYGITFTF
nr:immunoglobulin light chain junction region [Macaca mulatta]